ncbi:MAG: type II toxin-antitoxin system Phd/YefM family antitoxin [Planctomycetes bacterium]|nr:type II toxin-antitoxin system Phd/YefM family antitoxin [Planctomycetota bacterium]
MDLTRDIDSLTHFKRNTTEVIEQLKATGEPIVLTVNGKAEIVVQDAASYQRMQEVIDRAEAVIGIRKGLESMARGEGVPAEEAFERLRKKHNIPRGE